MTASLLVRVLGPLVVERDGVAVDVGGTRQKAVLARLVAAGGAVVTADRLVADVWGVAPPSSVLSSLQAIVSRLRRVLEPDRSKGQASLLHSRGGGYSLAVRTDVDSLSAAIARTDEPLDAATTVRILAEAVASWQGEPYAELGEQSWLVGERARCHELRLAAVRRLGTAHLAAGSPEAAGVAVLPAVEADQGNERVVILLAVALFRQGRQAEALSVCRRARNALAEDHGLDPGVELRQVEAAILAQDEALMPATVPPVSHPARPAEVTAQWTAPPGTPRHGEPLAGRERERAVLSATAALILSGQPRTIVLTGEPGIGKTSLAQSLAGELIGQGWLVCWGRCSDSTGVPALWPWLQVLAELAAARPLPDSLRSLVDGDAVGEADVPAARWRQRRDIGAYLRATAQDAPLLVIIDDLQWADAASHLVLGDLAESLAGSRVGFLATSRTAVAGAGPIEVLARLARAGSVRLPIGGLSVEDVRSVSSSAGLDVDATALTERTGGNPFLLRETLALATTTGQSPLSVVAATVQDVLRARVALLPASASALLSVASVLGRVVDGRLLATVDGAEVERIERDLDLAAEAGLLVPAGSGRMRFVHDLVRETLYHGLPPLRRARLHGRALAALETAGGRGPVELATHAVAAGPDVAPSAVRYAVAAAVEAQGRLAHASAVQWWQQALDAESIETQESIGTAGPGGRVELLLGLVRAQLDAGDAVGALETRSLAIRAADATGDGLLTARALVAMDRPVVWLLRAHDSVELSLVRRIEAALRSPLDDERLVLRLQATLALELYDGRQDPRCDELSSLAVTGARRVGDPALLAFALNARQLSVAFPGREPERAELADELVLLGTTCGLSTVELVGHQLAQQARLQLGQRDVADGHARRARELAAQLSMLLPALQQSLWDSSRLALDGDFDGALRKWTEVERMPWLWWARDAMLAAVRLTLLLRAGRMAEAAPLLAATAMVHPRLAVDAEVLVRADAGDRAGAARTFASMPTDLPRDWTWLAATCIQASAAVACGSRSAIEESTTLLAPWAGRIAASGSIDAGPVEDYLELLRRWPPDSDPQGGASGR